VTLTGAGDGLETATGAATNFSTGTEIFDASLAPAVCALPAGKAFGVLVRAGACSGRGVTAIGGVMAGGVAGAPMAGEACSGVTWPDAWPDAGVAIVGAAIRSPGKRMPQKPGTGSVNSSST